MKGLVQSSSVQYAVIKVSSTERLVIVYPDEKSLRDLIAGPSIIGLGFASREEAVASLEDAFPDKTVSKQMPRTTAMVDGDQNHELTSQSVRRGLADWFGFSKSRRMARNILQFAVTTAILIFYSKSVVPATIRTALGVS